jgi:hypothetical protein
MTPLGIAFPEQAVNIVITGLGDWTITDDGFGNSLKFRMKDCAGFG